MSTTHSSRSGPTHHRRAFTASYERRRHQLSLAKSQKTIQEIVPRTAQPQSTEENNKRLISDIRPAKKRQSRSLVLSRHALRPKNKRSRLRFVALSSRGIAILVIVINVAFGGYFLLPHVLNDTSQVAMVDGASSESTDANVLGEVASQEAVMGYPKEIQLGSGHQANVVIGGVGTDSKLIYADNENSVSWFERSAKPGSKGAVMIYMDQSTEPSKQFASHMKEVSNNSEITLLLSSGQSMTYTVVENTSIARDRFEMSKMLDIYRRYDASLNILITSSDPSHPYAMIYAVHK